jgi:phosphoribosylformylglycinamidine synthase I
MKFGVTVFPGSNCDEDLVYVLKHVMQQEVVKLWHKDADLKGCDFILLPGGFSYGDYLRSGAIARFSPIMDKVIAHAEKGGFVMGICNGFQILTESHLLPGALLRNDNQKFNCKNVLIKPENNYTIIT